jgi:hypothetical protein
MITPAKKTNNFFIKKKVFGFVGANVKARKNVFRDGSINGGSELGNGKKLTCVIAVDSLQLADGSSFQTAVGNRRLLQNLQVTGKGGIIQLKA